MILRSMRIDTNTENITPTSEPWGKSTHSRVRTHQPPEFRLSGRNVVTQERNTLKENND